MYNYVRIMIISGLCSKGSILLNNMYVCMYVVTIKIISSIIYIHIYTYIHICVESNFVSEIV